MNKKSFKDLSDAEKEIMSLLWNSDKSLSVSEILEYFNNTKNKNWKQQTLSTLLGRMLKKGMVLNSRQGKNIFYAPSMTYEKYNSNKAKGLLDNLYDGSIRKFMTALYDGNNLSDNSIKELKNWLDDNDI